MLETNNFPLISTRGRPWQRIHIDFTRLFLGNMFLIVADAHSKWIEATVMTTTIASKTITELHKMFAAYGLPKQVISDNSPQFISNKFDEFLKKNGIKHLLTSPYHLKSNGEAERAVQTFKSGLKARARGRKWGSTNQVESVFDVLSNNT